MELSDTVLVIPINTTIKENKVSIDWEGKSKTFSPFASEVMLRNLKITIGVNKTI